MIRHSRRYCKNGDGRLVFAHDLCIYCYRREILYPKQKLKEKKIYRIKPVSDKRVKLNAEYKRKKEVNNEKLKAEKRFKCFFTQKPFDKNYDPDYHHTLGKDGDLLADMEYAFPCYFEPHREYHDLKYDKEHLDNCTWYWSWLERIKTELPIVYYKEIKKIEKANGKTIYPKE